MNIQRMTGEEDTMVESGMVVMEVIVEEAMMMVVAMMQVEKVNEEKKALAIATETTIGIEVRNRGLKNCRFYSL